VIKRIFATVLVLCVLPGWLRAQATKPGTPPTRIETPTQPTIIKVPVNLVNVPLTVIDQKNRLVINLTKDDFKVFEDGKPQTIQYFSRETDLALRIGLLIDTSTSVRGWLRFEQQAAAEFLNDTMRRGKDEAFVVGFDGTPQLVQDYTDNLEKLANAIRGLRAGGITSLYDAVYNSCKEKLLFFPPPEPYLRRVMIVISDGDDNHSEHTRDEALSMAQRAEVTIFAIKTNRSGVEERGDMVLKSLSEKTGGRAFGAFDTRDLAAEFRWIGLDLRNQFLLSYTSTNTARDGTYRKIKILPVNKNLHVRAKAGYFAPSQ
jgi:Ca-activated chloride channel family protein